MNARVVLALCCVVVFALVAWVGTGPQTPPLTVEKAKPIAAWELLEQNERFRIFRANTQPAAYLLDVQGHGLLIDAPEDLPLSPVRIETVLLTHHHRDSVAAVPYFMGRGIPVRASPESAKWLTPENVTKFWAEAIPLRNSRTAYFVVGSGIPGITYDIKNEPLNWYGIPVQPIATPGHSFDHTAYLANGFLFCGDAITGSGHLHTPFTTDWDHWQDVGLKPTAESLRKMAALNPISLMPARGKPMNGGVAKFLEDAATRVDEAGFMKSYERYTNRLGKVPEYKQLVPKEQIGSGGDKPWSRVSENIWITGNTYVVTSKQNKACMVIDPWGERSVKQIEKLRADEKLGPIERVVFSHAHYDHFDGVYTLPGADGYKVWALETVAEPLRNPFKLRAPFLDARPIKFDQNFRDGEIAPWREYLFTFRHLPGQTWYTSGIEATIDDKRCFFTADNFFHHTQYSGTGGWMGLNRSSPIMYASSAKKVLDAKPEWVLAEHGGPFIFNAEDFTRRVRWGIAAAKAMDAVSISGKHRHDWNPHRFWVEPIRAELKAGQQASFNFYGLNESETPEPITVIFRGPGIETQQFSATIPAKKLQKTNLLFRMPADVKPGRYIFDVIPRTAHGEACDPFFCVDIVE